jgi:hypothetical protein
MEKIAALTSPTAPQGTALDRSLDRCARTAEESLAMSSHPRGAFLEAGALAVALLVAAAPAWAADAGGVVVRTSASEPERERQLVDALRIYMRDLHRAVRLGDAAPASLGTVELERVADDARRDGDDVVVWFGVRDGAAVLYAYRVASADLRETAVEVADPFGSARALALKVRALVTRSVDDEAWRVPPEVPPAVETTPPAPAAPPRTGPPATPSPPAPASPPSLSRALARPANSRVELAAAYAVVVPTTPAWTRQGVTLRLAIPWGRLPAAALVDAGLTLASPLSLDGGTVSTRVWPIGVAVVARLARPRWRLAAGPRASLQIVEASAHSPDGRHGAATTVSAGLGLYAEGAWLFSRHVGAFASIGGEALLPRQQFASAGPTATDLGWAQFTFGAGLTFAIP